MSICRLVRIHDISLNRFFISNIKLKKMGVDFSDKFSLLHFSVGIIFRFFHISLENSIILHTLFEILENSKLGIKFIDKQLKFWPGGKRQADTLINSIGDLFYFICGWIIADYIHT